VDYITPVNGLVDRLPVPMARAAKSLGSADGAPPIELLDGEQLAELLKDLQLGVRTESIEKVDVDEVCLKAFDPGIASAPPPRRPTARVDR
jgi:hypothetical protein